MTKLDVIKFLIEDEEEAIRGYMNRRGFFSPSEVVKIDRIIFEELQHIDILKSMIGDE